MQDFIRAEPLAFCHSEGATATEESRSGQEAKGSPPLLAFALTEPTFGKKAAGVKMTKKWCFYLFSDNLFLCDFFFYGLL